MISVPTTIKSTHRQVLDALPLNLPLHRLGGGYETDVFRTDDDRYVVKLKRVGYRDLRMAVAHALLVRSIAEYFADCLGPEHSLPSTYGIARHADGALRVITVQPFLKDARPLFSIDHRALPRAERRHIMAQLHTIIQRSQACYRATGLAPDLYGVSGTTPGEVARLHAPYMAPVHLWHFFMTRTLLRSHNLLLTTDHRVVLVDYDLVMLHKPRVVRRMYFAFRAVLFWRDRAVIRLHANQ